MKKIIRNEILKRREAVDKGIVLAHSTNIVEKFKGTELYKNSKNVMIYVSFRNEVDTLQLIKDMLLERKRVFVPLTQAETKDIIVSEIIDIENDLEIGNFQVMEPKKDKIRVAQPNQLDLIIVPGVAFDTNGYRIGYGGGYYDRFLSKLPNTTTISLAFELQMVDKIPVNHYDIPVDYIVTEDRYIQCKV